jgi:sugar lactone lactonase YvrE
MFTGLLIGLAVQLSLMAEPLLKPGDIVYADGGWDVVLRYDPQTQETNLVAGFEFTDARGNIAVGHNGDIYGTRAKLGFGPYAEFFVIDGVTGAMRELSTQRLIKSAYRMKLAPDGEWLYVAGEDATNRAIYKVEIATGNQVLVTTNFTNEPDYERPYDLAFDGQGGFYVSDFNYGNLLHFDATGARRRVSSGGMFDFIGGIDVDAAGYVYVASRNYDGVVRVDPATGEQSSVTRGGFLGSPGDLCVAPDGSLLVTDAGTDVLVRVDVTTGEQTVLAQGSPGPRSPLVFAPKSNVRLSTLPTEEGLQLRWTDSSGGFVLEERSSLGGDGNNGNWTAVTPAPAGNGNGEYAVTVSLTGEQRFFRLRKGP